MEIKRVNIDDLDWNDYIYHFNGKPFFGMAYELFENGRMRTETEFQYGMEHGKSKEWDNQGRILEEFQMQFGTRHGLFRSWYINGQLKILAEYELGILLNKQEWDENGNLTSKFELTPADSNYKVLLINRDREPARIEMIKHRLENKA